MEKSIGENPASNRIIPIEKKIVEDKNRENTPAHEKPRLSVGLIHLTLKALSKQNLQTSSCKLLERWRA